MNDDLIAIVAETDAYASRTPLPRSTWSREDALLEIERRTGMNVRENATSTSPDQRDRQDLRSAAARPSDLGRTEAKRRWVPVAVIAAAFLAVLTVGLVLRGGWVTGDSEMADQPTEPIEVVEEFFARTASDVDDAMLLAPEASMWQSPPKHTRSMIEYQIATGGTFTVSECRLSASPGVVWCHVEYHDPVIDALDLPGGDSVIRIEDGVITRVDLPSYTSADIRLAAYARRVDPDGYASGCADPGDDTALVANVVFNRRCGEFLAPLFPGLVAEIETEQTK